MKKLSTIVLTIVCAVLITCTTTTAVFAEEYKSEIEHADQGGSDETKLFPSIHALSIQTSDQTFDDLINNVNYYGRIVYKDDVAIGESYYAQDESDNYSLGYSDNDEGLLVQALREYEQCEVIVVTDFSSRFLLVRDDNQEFATPVYTYYDGKTITYKDNVKISIKDFINAVVYRNNYEYEGMIIHGPMEKGSSVLAYIGEKQQMSPMVYIYVSIAIVVGIIVIILKARKFRKQ